MQRTWYLWPVHEMEETADDFVVKATLLRITVRNQGGTLELNVDEPAPANAPDALHLLGQAYARALSGSGLVRTLRTREEFAALPPWAFQNLSMVGGSERGDEERARVRRAVRAARNALLADPAGDETLRRSYEYLEDARESQRTAASRGGVGETSLFYLYKAVEAVENALGGERRTIAALKVENELRFAKRLANQPDRDERHAPAPGDAPNPATPAEVARAIDSAATVVRAYATRP